MSSCSSAKGWVAATAVTERDATESCLMASTVHGDVDSEEFLTQWQQIFREHLLDGKNTLLYVSFIRFIKSDSVSKDAILISKHIFGNDTID
eukprot:5014024-Pleurochrysis_carterae.AAC.1